MPLAACSLHAVKLVRFPSTWEWLLPWLPLRNLGQYSKRLTGQSADPPDILRGIKFSALPRDCIGRGHFQRVPWLPAAPASLQAVSPHGHGTPPPLCQGYSTGGLDVDYPSLQPYFQSLLLCSCLRLHWLYWTWAIKWAICFSPKNPAACDSKLLLNQSLSWWFCPGIFGCILCGPSGCISTSAGGGG